MNTKEKIFDVSLDLFSKKGYDSVSLREIAEEVGIKKALYIVTTHQKKQY